MKNKLIYITYQTFPATTANSIQTISTLKHLSRQNIDVSLIFPLRNKESSSNLSYLQEFYDFNDEINTIGTIHPLPFKKIKFFEKTMYLLSHFMWSYFTVKKYSKNKDKRKFFTRSEWVFYFLSKKDIHVVYECHQLSKLKKVLINQSLKKANSKIIALTTYLKEEIGHKDSQRVSVIGSAYDNDFFFSSTQKDNVVVYAGSLNRFGISRGLDILLNSFKNLTGKEVVFKIISSNDEELEDLKTTFLNLNPSIGIETFHNLNPTEVAKLMSTAKVGLLINNQTKHSEYYSSPLKYFEYLAAGLNIVATDLKSHKTLPYNDHIKFYSADDRASFEMGILEALEDKNTPYGDLNLYSMETRVTNIIKILF